MIFETNFSDENYSAYGTVVEITDLITFIESVRGKACGWQDLQSGVKEAKIIDASFSLKGISFNGTLNTNVITKNPMYFPRSGLEYDNGMIVPNDAVPDEIQMYVACFIYASMSIGYSDNISGIEKPISSKSVGSVNISYDTNASVSSEYGTKESFINSCSREHIPDSWIDELVETFAVVGSIPKTRQP